MRRIVAAVCALTVAATACGSDPALVRSDRGRITSGGQLSVRRVRVGDCFQMERVAELTEVQGVPCRQPHDAEAYASVELRGLTGFEGADAVYDPETLRYESQATCRRKLSSKARRAQVDIGVLLPTAEGWRLRDERKATCFLSAQDGARSTGSLR